LPDKYVELIHAEVDGAATARELAALRDYLASHPEEQKVRAELVKLNDVLSRVEEVETPADLRTSILAALPARRPISRAVARNISPWWSRLPSIRYGYALAAGLLLGAALTGVAFRNLTPLERSDVYGTLAARQDTTSYVAVGQTDLHYPDLGGSVQLSRSGSNAMMVFDLHSQKAVEVEFDGGPIGLISFGQQPGAIPSFEAKDGTISFQSEGKQRTTVILKNQKNAPLMLNVRFYVSGKLIHQGTLGARDSGGFSK
jgi:hypothetical protein